LIRGEVSIIGKDVDDQILLKSDGFPTYHLANVVDDHLMKISHIIRGEEWLPSTPKHALLYRAFGWECPLFAHLPLLLNNKKQKLSKRHGDVAVEDFKAKGYSRDAFVNFIALLGFNPSGEREIYDIEELIEAFDLSKCNKSGAVFDLAKLEWMNAQYLRKTPLAELVAEAMPLVTKMFGDGFGEEYVGEVMTLVKERIHFVKDMPAFTDYMFKDEIEYEEAYVKKRWVEGSEQIARDLLERYEQLDDFSHDALYKVAQDYVAEKEIKLGPITHPLRIMITGKAVGAGIFETMAVLGKEKSIKRMKDYLNK
jgi:glutamyl-tRNA synthetase